MKKLALLSFSVLTLGFATSSSAQALTFSQVKPILDKCEACHTANAVDAPFLNLQPFESADKQTSWVATILERLNRPEGSRGRMPKRAEEWDPSAIAALKLWLMQGAPNDTGEPTAPVTLPSAAAASEGRAPQSVDSNLRKNISFTQNWSRYPSPDSILATLHAQFPNVNVTRVSSECLSVTSENENLLGSSNPLIGEATIKDPNSAFLVWYSGCVKEFAKLEKEKAFSFVVENSQTKPEILKYYSPETVSMCERIADCSFSDLPAEKRVAVIQAEVERLIGPDEVIKDSGIAPSLAELATRIDFQISEVTVKKPSALSFLQITVGPNGRLQMTDAVALVRFLTLLNDTLKY